MLTPLITAIHVITIVLWIGGVSFVTIIVFPMLLRMEGFLEKVMFFQGVEHRFAKLAKIYVAIAGITGFLILHLNNEYSLLFTSEGLGITLMLIAWVFYVLVLLFEKRIFLRLFSQPEKLDTSQIFFRLSVFHWFVIGLSLLAVAAGVWEGHGGRL